MSTYLSGATSCCWSGLSKTSKFWWSNTSTKATTGSVLEDLDDPRAMTCQINHITITYSKLEINREALNYTVR